MQTGSENVILEMRNISKSFGGIHALRDVSFRSRTGIIHALVGENGAGKSTLIKILAGAYHADSGEIIYKGQSYTDLGTREALDIGIRVIYQELTLIPDLSVAENIFLGHEPVRRFGVIDRKRVHERAAQVLMELGVELALKQPVGELTIANQQMVEIAKALSQEADLLIMDEPSAILAGHELERLFKIIESLNRQGVTIIYISHRLEEIFQIAHEVTVLRDGEVVGTQAIESIDRPRLIQMMVGRSLDEVFPTGIGEIGEAVLSAHKVITDRLPEPFDIILRSGEVVGVAGMVGAGRTELARALFGVDKIQSGEILIDGKHTSMKNPQDAVQAGMALVPEDRKSQGLFMGLPIRNNITMTIIDLLTRYGVIQRLDEASAVEKARRDLSIVMAAHTQEVQYLSGGNQQKVVLAKWLETAPKVIVLDEPTRGVDVGAKFEIYQLIRQLSDRGVGILMISSELPEIMGMSDRIIVMHEGRIVGEFVGGEATEEAIIELATLGYSIGGVNRRNRDREADR